MNSSKKLAAIVAMALTAGLAGLGCAAQTEGADEMTAGQDGVAAGQPSEESQPGGATEEKTGEASEKCGGGCGCGCGLWWEGPFCGVWAGGFPWLPLLAGCGGCGGWSPCWAGGLPI